MVEPAERLVLVEDSAELRPDHPHVVALEARPPNIEGAGEVTLRDLVRQALRMRPDRLVVGEVRGAEVVDLLAALNTGHEGGCGTMHANSAGDVPARVEALALAAGLRRERRTASSRRLSTRSCTSVAGADGRGGSGRWRCPCAVADGLVPMRAGGHVRRGGRGRRRARRRRACGAARPVIACWRCAAWRRSAAWFGCRPVPTVHR